MVNPVVMTRYDIIRIGQRGIVLCDQIAFPLLFCSGRKRKTQSGHARLLARLAMEEGLLSVWVSQVLVSHS